MTADAPPDPKATPADGIPPPRAALDIRRALEAHPVHGAVRSAADLRVFLAHHVVAVWDFMALLKSLQRDLTCVTSPWTPPADPEAARFVNEIVLAEETDEVAPGRFLSHFAWYLEAMDEVGADTGPIRGVLADVARGVSGPEALRASALPPAARAFGLSTMRFLERPVHVRAAVFLHGREAVIPAMFVRLVEGLLQSGVPCSGFLAYLERHVAVDAGEHGPLGERLLARLVGDDPRRRADADRAATLALEARLRLWDAIHGALREGTHREETLRGGPPARP